MNQRNVEALKALIDKAKDAESDDYPPCETDWLARCLASMGVLVPSALTAQECDVVFDAAMHVYHLDGPEPELERPMVSAPPGYAWDWECGPLTMALERIAKGGGIT